MTNGEIVGRTAPQQEGGASVWLALGVAVAIGAAALGLSLAKDKPKKAVETSASDTTLGSLDMLPGVITSGEDSVVQDENDRGLYECGGVKGESWKNTDGTPKPFSPDKLIAHMNNRPALARSDSNFWVDKFGGNGMSFLATNGFSSSAHDSKVKITAPGVSSDYSAFIEKQISAPMETDVVAINHGCKRDNVHVVGLKQLKPKATTLTGVVLENTKFDDGNRDNNNDLLDAMAKDGKTLKEIIVQPMNIDTNKDGSADKKVVIVFNKHLMCGNNLLKAPEIPIVATTTTKGDKVTTTTDRDTPSTSIVRSTTTTTNGQGKPPGTFAPGESTTTAPKPPEGLTPYVPTTKQVAPATTQPTLPVDKVPQTPTTYKAAPPTTNLD